MKLYKIRDWGSNFENNRSRELISVKWVVMPNKHDGENYSMIMRHERAAEIFAGWVLLLQIASKCNPRGVLIKGNGTPHTPHSLAVKSQAPAGWFELALDYLEKHTDWIEVEEVAQNPAPTCGIPAPRDEERRERKKGREENGALAETPSWEEFFEYCKMHGLPAEWYARDKFLAANSDNWKGKANWTSYADRCRTWWESDGRQMNPPKSKHQKGQETLLDKELKAFEKL